MDLCTAAYESPLGKILFAADGDSLAGLWFVGQRHFPENIFEGSYGGGDSNVIARARLWLDLYFRGKIPDFTPRLKFSGTPFQSLVQEFLLRIPYGETCTYKDLAEKIFEETGRKTSARAVGSAVGRNAISIIVPCHRVVGAGGKLVGYAGGIPRKQSLLMLEGCWPLTAAKKFQGRGQRAEAAAGNVLVDGKRG